MQTYKQNNKAAITPCTVPAEICNLCVADLDNVSGDFQSDAATFLKFEVLLLSFQKSTSCIYCNARDGTLEQKKKKKKCSL